ncbi:hypothetical protein [Oscillibacter sp.]|uniref:hypothetical protein n=1 Tax=Oscillibacter sp. TaxID=1945593 RepID=UPI0028AC6F07|nr:hypothetical protein [Oscillibacter sp.]
MKTVTIRNLSSFADFSAIARVAFLISGDEYCATHDDRGNEAVRISRKGNTYTVLDKEAVQDEA